MQKLRIVILFIFFLVTVNSQAQQNEKITGYINQYKDLAIAEMKRTGVPAAITLAQGIHESGAGKGKLVLESNNHFGIKCKSNWKGETVKHDDDAKGECFRKYSFPEESYKDHSDFLKNGQRYAFLFSLDPADYKGWANGLKQAGYATNPKYPDVLIRLIEDYALQDYTSIALGKRMEKEPGSQVSSNAGVSMGMNNSVKENETPVIVPLKIQPDYPEGQFRINETKVTFVKKETSFLAIAKEYDVDLSKIFEFNEIPRTDISDKNQLIYLQRKRKTGSNEFHIVLAGETLHDIAQQQAIRLESLKELNWLDGDEKPAIGERLSLKAKSKSKPLLAIKENYSLVPAIKNQSSH